MADTRTMAQLLQAPTEGYEDAILIPEIVANNFNCSYPLLQQDHLHNEARIWLEKEPPRSIQTWDDLVSKFINHFFPQAVSSDVAELKDIVRALLLDKKNQASAPAPAPVKAVEL
ncbi:reverse transcriptase domain-containing protein, partial [Tanacetum coccineum]